MLAALFSLYVPDEFKVYTAGFVFAALSIYTFSPALKGVLYVGGTAAMAGSYTQSFVSAQGINMREFYPILIRKFGNQGLDVVGTFTALGWTSTLGAQVIEHFEDDWIYDNFKVMSQAGGGTTATLTIDPSSINTTTGTFYPGVKDMIEFPNRDAQGNYIQAYVTAIGSNTISVQIAKPSLGWTIPATTDGQELFIPYNISGEGTGQPAPKVVASNLVQNKYTIVKTSMNVTGSEMTDPYWFNEYMGKKGIYAITKGTLELDHRQLVAENGAFLSGFQTENLTDNSKPVTGTQGLIPTLNSTSIQAPYTTWGTANLDIINKSLSRVFAGNATGMFMGLDIYTTAQNTLFDLFKHTNIDYVRDMRNGQLFGTGDAGKELAMNVDFGYITKTKRDYAFKLVETFNNPKTYGTDGYDYTRRYFAFPLRNDNLDVVSKAKIPAMQTVYRAKGDYKRSKEMFWTGSADANFYGNTNDIDERVLNCRTEMGCQFFAANQFVNGRPSF